MERRLVAVLAADMVGYSKLMATDEAGTIARQKSHRADLIDPKIAQYGGRIVKTTGDGMLVEFTSVVDAVQCAVEIQHAMPEREAEVPETKRVQYRIGVNLGDIVIDGDDILGDGVNIAARLENLADAGGICISRPVHTQIKGKLNLNFEGLGDKQVKNIPEPVSVYRVVLDDQAAMLATPISKQVSKKTGPRWAIAAAVAGILFIVVASLFWWRPWATDFEPVSTASMSLPLPDQPSLAVLPFDNMSGSEEHDYFADGFTEDLITDASKLPGVFVIARNSTFTYKGKPTKVQQVAQDLGVRYVLEGSVRRTGDRVRINAQLVDAITGHHLWAERYDGSTADVFAFQDQVVGQIIAALALELSDDERAAAEGPKAASPEAYEAFLQGRDLHRRKDPEAYPQAIERFETAIELDPNYSPAYAGLAALYWNVILTDWEFVSGVHWAHAFDKVVENVAKAKELNPPSPLAYRVSGALHAQWGDYEKALLEIEQAIELDPNEAESYATKARILNASGRAKEAEAFARLAIRLNPHQEAEYLSPLGRALLHQKKYAEAAEVFEKVVAEFEDPWLDYDSLVSTYGHLGEVKKARTITAKYDLAIAETGYTPLSVHEAGLYWGGDIFDYHKPYLEDYLAGLKKAGVRPGPMSGEGYRALLGRDQGEYTVEGATEIDVTEAKTLVDRGVKVVDVRDAGNYHRGRIPNAINIDLNLDFAEENLAQVVAKDEEFIVHCWGKYCPYSAIAAAKAVRWGYTRVYRLADGVPGWEGAGYPIEKTDSGS